MTYKRKIPRLVSRVRRAIDLGLEAGALMGANRTRTRLIPNYYGGKLFKYKRTGNLSSSIYVGKAFTDKKGRRAARYGVDKNARYALFWEIGFWKKPSYFSEKLGRWVTITKDIVLKATTHVNWKSKKKLRQSRDMQGRFAEYSASAKKWYRKPIWVPTFIAARPAMTRAFARTVRRFLETGK